MKINKNMKIYFNRLRNYYIYIYEKKNYIFQERKKAREKEIK